MIVVAAGYPFNSEHVVPVCQYSHDQSRAQIGAMVAPGQLQAFPLSESVQQKSR